MTEGADLVVTGRIATLEGASGFGWVDAIAITQGNVVAAGDTATVDAAVGPRTPRLDLGPDEVVVPGLIDAHLHLAQAAISVHDVDLAGLATVDDALARIAEAHHALAAGTWLKGHGWDADRWGGPPSAAVLERACPGRPAALWAHDHHAVWVNESALRVAGIDASTPDPPGGAIRRDPDGNATGILSEAATRLVIARIPGPGLADFERAIAEFSHELIAVGVTGVHDPGMLAPAEGLGPVFGAYHTLAQNRRLPLRVHVAIREEQLQAATEIGLRSGISFAPDDVDDFLRFGWLKLFADGTLGSRTATMIEPFEREPGWDDQPGGERGIWVTPPERLADLAEEAARVGITTQIHAIGDEAVRRALDALAPTAGRTSLVPRLEHVQIADAADVPRFGAAGVAASIQPVHLRSDAAAARRRWGRRAEASGYRVRSLLDAGALVCFGTDAPVEPIDPWPGLEIAVTRRSTAWPAGTPPFGRREAVTLAEALRAATVGPAMSARTPDRGRLTPGSRADLVVLDAATLAEPVEAGGPLGRARPRLVLVNGAIAYEAPASERPANGSGGR
jgi:predicted amidohydrolase YtcJ